MSRRALTDYNSCADLEHFSGERRGGDLGDSCYAGLIMMRATHAIFLEMKYLPNPEAIWPDDLTEAG